MMEEDLNNICEECKKKRKESVTHNLIKHGYKVAKFIRVLKTIFPI